MVGVLSIVVYVVVAGLLLEPYGLISLMIADAIKHCVHTALMIWILRRHAVALAGYGILRTLAKSSLAALATGGAALAVLTILEARSIPSLLSGRLLDVLLPGIVGVLAFTGMVYLLDISDAKQIRQRLRRPSA
jgi:peptidoglycan biosynthesis protein MviN/MurJ (putative lipid II flippase)